MDTIELTKQQALILNELADILAPDYKGNELVLEGLAQSAQATQDEIQDTLGSVFTQTFHILQKYPAKIIIEKEERKTK